MKVTIFGTGYVGLVTGTCLAEIGHEVMCIDVDKQKIDNLRQGIMPIYEPGLEELVKRNTKEGRLEFSTNAGRGVSFATVIFSAVGTPPDENHKADLKYVKAVAKTVGEHITAYKVFVNKSTVPVGTGEMCREIITQELKNRNKDLEFDVVSNPEFLKEGSAIKDFMAPNRIVCGLESEKAKEAMKELYKPLVRLDRPLIFTDTQSAEVIKYAANSFLATKISFINEVANFAELVGANIKDISKGIGLDERIGSKFLHAGIGYGGSCFPKDVQALIETGKENGFDFKIISAVEEVNYHQKTRVIDKLVKHMPDLKGKTIAIRGLAFKPRTDDIREAPSIRIIRKLISLGVAKIQCFDPIANTNMKKVFSGEKEVLFFGTNYDALEGADALLILTERDEFRAPNREKIEQKMQGKVIIDGRNIWNRQELEGLGYLYEGIGL